MVSYRRKGTSKHLNQLIDEYLKLSRRAKARRTETWQQQMDQIHQKRNHGFDIKATEKGTIQSCVELYGQSV